MNGTPIIEARDPSYRRGQLALGVGTDNAGDEAEARFDNLLGMNATPAGQGDPPMPAASAPPVTMTLLIDESLASPAPQLLPILNVPAAGVTTGYDGGDFFIRQMAGAGRTGLFLLIPRTETTDVTVAVDARLVGDVSDRQLAIYCRQTEPRPGGSRMDGYRLVVLPDLQAFALDTVGDGGRFLMLRSGLSTAIRTGTESNRLELSCIGDTLTARVNGELLTTVQDTMYQHGQVAIGVVATRDRLDIEARYRNLRIAGK